MVSKCIIKKNSYHDSVTLMIITKEFEALPHVDSAVVVMGTEHNRELLRNVGFPEGEIRDAAPNDLIIAVRLKEGNEDNGEELIADIVHKVDELLSKRKSQGGDEYNPPTLDSAARSLPDANLVLISLPGQYAAEEAKRALMLDKHVMLFSDNVTIDQERQLKELAVQKGLLMMGPDCGTAMINGTPLAFANVVRRGDIGIVGASGTGTQEIMVQIDRFGGGITHAIGTGGRDLKAEIGGLMMIQGIEALGEDIETKVIVLVSKPPAPEIAEKVLRVLQKTGKPAVVDFIGGSDEMIKAYGFVPASTLEDAAFKAVEVSKALKQGILKQGALKTDNITAESAPEFYLNVDMVENLAEDEAAKLSKGQKYLRGLYSGGTLCDETLKLFTKAGGDIYSNIPLDPKYKLPENTIGYKHSAVDLGDDEYTVGRPHPMIDPYMRRQMIFKAAEDEEMAVLLMDVVLGYGSHQDPAGSIAEPVKAAKAKFAAGGKYLCVVACICGTEGDPQDYADQRRKLQDAGIIVMPSNAQAIRFAMKVIGR